ncbi:three-Cys-motif partner protein [Candidatus Electrothrix aarhusensis]|uniref:Three-Cys-motif partner protein n=1 Tax=Candidatus Electrothrix aarhusensis TaxID=1859131 RepID=A0A444ITP0_9BACT|nr:three-Cys-motif partner protein [Candidatus Electrothrix aarhusensis]
MNENSFFKEQKEQSLVKSIIVAKYFDVWSTVIISTQKRYPQHSQKIAYIDLFAGPGRYNDGSQSTPLKILTNAIEKPDLCRRLVAIFNDKDEDNSKTLSKTIEEIPGIEKLKYKPQIDNQEVGEEIVNKFESMNLVPTLFFVDPWGYKGLSLRLVNSVLKDWGCDCLFFFNYNRISMGLSNPLVKEHMDALFGRDRADELRSKLANTSPEERELMIVEALCQAIKSYGSRYTLPFRFKDSKGKRTSHHLIFVSKHFRGYEIMKDIMSRESTSDTEGVPSFEYNPADFLPKQTLLFQLSRPIDDLKKDLLDTFAGQRLTMKKIYEEHNVDTPYIIKNYKNALRVLYDEDLIDAISPKGKPPRKNSFAETIIVTFPRQEKQWLQVK